MKQELFNHHLLDDSRWLKKSRELMISARYLVVVERTLYSTGHDVLENDLPEFCYHPFQAWASVGSAAALLLGLALENFLKGYLVSVGKIEIDSNNKVHGLSGSHDLVKMLSDVDCELSPEEEKSIRRLTYQIQTLSKYHLAKKSTKQGEFTGQVESSELIYNLVFRLGKRLLTDEQFSHWTSRDHEYDHVPETPQFMDEETREEIRKHLRGRGDD